MAKETETTNTIVKTIEINAPVAKVWEAITDYQKFGAWFRVKLEAPFRVGEKAVGFITYPGYEHYRWEAVVQKIEPQTLFSFTWHPYAIDQSADYSQEKPTLIEFKLKPTATGTHLTVTESGFDHIPAHRRDLAFRMNEQGWAQQVKNIEAFVAENQSR